MKLKLYLLLPLLLISVWAIGQNSIIYKDVYQTTQVVLNKNGSLYNGKVSFSGVGTDSFGTTYTYNIRWCTNYNNQGFNAWVMDSDLDHPTCQTGNAYYYNKINTDVPPPLTVGAWVEVVGSQLQLSGDGLFGAPVLTTDAPSAIGVNNATMGGNVTYNGGATVTERGVVYATSPTMPTLVNNKASLGSGNGVFSGTPNSLAAGTTYNVRAYAINSFTDVSNGQVYTFTGYGNQQSFTTLTPTITATAVSAIPASNYGTASSPGTFTVAGANMLAGILVAAPAGFEVSLSAGSGYGTSVTVGAAGTISATTVYVRLAASNNEGNYSGTINLTSNSAVSKTSAIGTSTVNKLNITVKANNTSKNYGTLLNFASDGSAVSITAGSLSSGASITAATLTSAEAVATANAGTGNISINNGSVVIKNASSVDITANYNITLASGTLTINPVTLTYTATSASRAYGASNPVFSGTITGFVLSQTQATATTGTLAFTSAATTSSNIGTYAINGSGLTANNGNYVFAQAGTNNTALTINTATLTYSANAASRAYGASNPAFSGTVTGFANGETLATATTGTLAFTSATTTSSNAGSYAINGSGLTANNGNYTFVQAAANSTALSISPVSLTYTADPASRAYGASNPAFSGTVTGFVLGQTQATATTGTLAFTSAATTSSNVGSYAINGSGLTANNGNYTFAQAGTNSTALTITSSTLTYTANPASRVYGASNPAFSGTITGFVLGQTQATATTGTLAFTSPANSVSPVGQYSINGSGLTANNGNYTFVQASGNATALTINPAPPVVIGTSNATYTEKGPAVAINAGIIVDDADNTTLASAKISIFSNYVAGEDVLSMSASIADIVASFDPVTGVLSLSSAGGATIIEFQQALRSVKYANTSSNPSTLNRWVSFTVNDGVLNSVASNSQVIVISVNDAPVLAGTSVLSYTEKDPAKVVNAAVTVSDADNANLASAKVVIGTNYVSGQDELQFANVPATMGDIAGTFDPATGTLALTTATTATLSQFEAALRAVKYINHSSNPSVLARTINFTVNDGTVNSNVLSSTVNIIAVNDAPAVVGTSNATYTEKGPAVAINAGIVVFDVDNAYLSSAKVSITSNYVAGQDVLSLASNPATMGDIIGTFDPATGMLSLSTAGGATPAQFEAALRAVKYSNTSSNPSTLNRWVSFIVNDGVLNSAASNSQVIVISVNDAPVLAGTSVLSYTEKDPAKVVNAAVTVSDADNANLASAKVVIGTNYVSGQDELLFANVPATMGDIAGTFDPATGTLALTTATTATLGQFEAALRSVKYINHSSNPSVLARTINFTVNDGAANSNVLSSTVNITAVNDAPAVVGTSNATYTEKGPAVAINAGIVVFDVDNAYLSSAKVSITSNYAADQDVLSLASNPATMGDIIGTFDPATGILSLSTAAGATPAQFEAALRAVKYSNTSSNPSTLNRWVSFIVKDGMLNSGASNSQVIVISVNDAPTVANAIPAQNAVEDSPFSLVFASNTFQDLDGDVLTYTARLAGGAALPSWLSFDGTNRKLSGTPNHAAVGTLAVEIIANDGNGGTGTASFNLVVAPIPLANITYVSPQNLSINVAITPIVPTNSGGLATYSISPALPNGLSFDPVSGTISGTPTVVSSATVYQVNATNASGTTHFNLTIHVIGNQAITFAALPNQTYGDAPFDLTATGGNSGNAINYTSSDISVATISGNKVTIVGAGTTTITANQAGNADYTAAPAIQQSLTIDKKNQAINFGTLANKTFGDAPFDLTATGTNSGIPLTYTSSNTNVATINGDKVTLVGAGTTNITVSQAGNANFNPATDVVQPLTVLSQDQTISFGALANKTFGDAPFNLTATGGGSGNPITYTSSNTTVATIQNNVVTLVGAGTTTITASQLGNANYNGATSVTQILTIDKALAVLSLNGLTQVYDGSAKTPAVNVSPNGIAGISLSYDGQPTAPKNVGTYAVVATLNNANYTAVDATGNLTINPLAIAVNADAKSKVYGDADPVLTYTFSPALVTGDSFTGSLSRSAGENVGDYTIGQNTLVLNSNYTLNYTGADLTIGKKAVNVITDAKSKVYGDSDPALTYTFSPALVTGDSFTGSLSRSAGENVGTYAINQNSLALNGNYTLNYTGADLTIGKKTITVTADAKSKVYGGTDPALTYTFSPALVSGDSFTGSLSRTIGENVGTYAINQNTLALNGNYTLNYTGADLTIGKKTITVTADARSKVYGDTDPALTYTFSPTLVTGDSFIGTLSRVTGENVGTYGINQNTLALNGNYTLNYTGADLSIGKKTVSVIADAKSKVYGDSDPTLTYTFSPALVTGDSFTGLLSRVTGENVGTYTINQNTLALNGNYTLNYTGADFSIGKKTVSVIVDAKSKVYGDADPALTYTFSPALVTGDSFTGSLSRTTGENVGTYAINQNSLALNGNYTLNYTGADLTIGKKTINVIADAKSKIYGDTDPVLTYTFSPALVIGDSFSGSLSRVTGENVGTYAINQNNLSLSGNYTLNYTGADLAISKKDISVIADAKSKVYGDADPILTYSFSPALITGDSFAGSLSRVTGENVGTYTINQNTLALNGNYTLNYTGADLTIGKKTIAVISDAKSKVYGDADPVLTYTFSPALVAGDSFTGSLSRVVGENVGTYAINQNSLALNGNYTLNYTGADLTIGKKTVNVIADAKSKVYGDVDPVLTYTFSPALIAGDSFTGSLSRVVGENVGTYAINQNSLALNGNYTLNYTGADLTIGKKIIMVTADTKSKVYGDSDPALTYTFSPALITGDSFTGSLSRAIGENVGTYAINQNNLSISGNYTLNYTGANLTIGKKTISITADAKSKIYGDADPALTYTFSPALVTGDGFTGSLSRTTGENVGTYAISQNNLSISGNYILNYTGADLTIGKKTISVIADAKNKVYGDADPVLTYTFSPALVTGDGFTGSLSRTTGENVGTYAISQNNLSLSGNYTLNYTGANLSIAKKALVITADNKTKFYNQANPVLTASYSGFVGTENASVLTSPVSLATTATLSSPAGTYPITASGAVAQNYAISYMQGALTVSSTSQTISFAALADKLSTDAPFLLTATASSGLTVSYASSDVSIARMINGNQVEILKAGTVNITASQAGNANYTAAVPVVQTLKIIDNPAPVITITSNLGNSISKGETAKLTATGAVTYQWATANGIIAGQNGAMLTVRPSLTTTYTVTGSNIYGRSSTQSITIEVKEDFKTLNATNILSPNGDGVNDYWIVENIDLYPNNSVTIFDRAGKTVFKTKGYKNNWDATLNGSPLSEGTYYYIIDFGAGFGTKKGFITIVR
ncbi:MBG domain-containing protein [Pedobacter sp. KR3-3]|uniref:MBG domain-containing protein n=1 Tax=Pedobacter albus TaxID=3113905 RepID=A0ABU7I2U1_9SPHI|nr:MBG domain-containing protein [Pedobacter sp. KR3-3]MEE1943784.1 MBG domain-containing protein [Pedobacter sp. KR3-3]